MPSPTWQNVSAAEHTGTVWPADAAVFALDGDDSAWSGTSPNYQCRIGTTTQAGLQITITSPGMSYSGVALTTAQANGLVVPAGATVAVRLPDDDTLVADPVNGIVRLVPDSVSQVNATSSATEPLRWADVRLAMTSNVGLQDDIEAGDVLDGLTLVAGDRVLLTAQDGADDNGIYEVQALGPQRAADADASGDFVVGKTVYVRAGTKAGRRYSYTGAESPTVGTTSLTFTVGALAAANSAGNGLSFSNQNASASPLT